MFFPGKISPSSEMPSAFTDQQAGGGHWLFILLDSWNTI